MGFLDLDEILAEVADAAKDGRCLPSFDAADVAKLAYELDRLRGLDVEVGRFLSVVDHRVAAGWTKLPPREVDRLRAVHLATSEAASPGCAS